MKDSAWCRMTASIKRSGEEKLMMRAILRYYLAIIG